MIPRVGQQKWETTAQRSLGEVGLVGAGEARDVVGPLRVNERLINLLKCSLFCVGE